MMRKRNMHCLGNVWNTMASHTRKPLALIQYLLEQFVGGFESFKLHSIRFYSIFIIRRLDFSYKISLNFLFSSNHLFSFAILAFSPFELCIYMRLCQAVSTVSFVHLFIWQLFFLNVCVVYCMNIFIRVQSYV